MTSPGTVSRRHAVAGAATLAGWFAAGAQTAPRPGGLRIGLIGCPAKDDRAGLLRNMAPLLAQTQMIATAVWDADRSRAAALAGSSGIAVDRFDKMIGKVDGILISDPRALSWHRQLAVPYLKAGVSVWIDGALAPSIGDAQAMLDAAAQGKAALMAGTIEEFFPTTRFLRRKANALAPLTSAMLAVSTRGKPQDKWGGIETVNAFCAIFGASVAKVNRIVSAGSETGYTITFEYGGGKGDPVYIVAQGMPRGADRLWARLYGSDMADQNHILSDDAEEDWLNSFLPAALAMQQMFQARKAPQSSADVFAKTRLYLASCRSSLVPDGKEFPVAELAGNWTLENAHPGYLPEKLA